MLDILKTFFYLLRFKQHWVFWVGPILGGITGAIAYEFVFNPRRRTFASYTNAYAGRPAAYINSHILPGAYMGHMQQVSCWRVKRLN